LASRPPAIVLQKSPKQICFSRFFIPGEFSGRRWPFLCATARCAQAPTRRSYLVSSADPDPDDRVSALAAERAIVIANANAEAIGAALPTTEMERGMMGIAEPKAVVFDGQVLDVHGRSVEEMPEAAGGEGRHGRGGQSRSSPCAPSLSASAKRESSLPQHESRSRPVSYLPWSAAQALVVAPSKRRHECRRGRQECLRHVRTGDVGHDYPEEALDHFR
jgi:hypothetical protein